jgi:hypothetical protein
MASPLFKRLSSVPARLWQHGRHGLSLGLCASVAITPMGWCVSMQPDPVGYHPKATKFIALTDITPTGDKRDTVVKVIDPKSLDPIFLKPKVVFKAPLTQQHGRFGVVLAGLTQPGTYQLQLGKTLLPQPITITPNRYWQPVTQAVNQLDGLQAPPANGGQLACDSEARYIAHSELGWRAGGKVLQKRTEENALALLLLMQWHQINPKIQRSLRVGQNDETGVLPAVALQLRWLMDLPYQNQVTEGVNWAAPSARCYTLLPASPSASLATIAALAKAATVFKKTDLGFAVKCLLTAEDLWEHLPSQLPPAHAHWLGSAATQLWLATQKPQYQAALLPVLAALPPTGYSPQTPLALALADLAQKPDAPDVLIKPALQWLNAVVPDTTTTDGKIQHVLAAQVAHTVPTRQGVFAVADALSQGAQAGLLMPVDVKSATGQLQKAPDPKLLTIVHTIWLNGMLNEGFNQMVSEAETANTPPPPANAVVNDNEDNATAYPGQAMLARWANKHAKKQ